MSGLEGENARLEQEIKRLNGACKSLGEERMELEKRNRRLEQSVKELEAQNEQLRKAYQTIHNDDCINYKARIAALEAALRDLLEAYFLPQDEFDTSDGAGPDIVESAVNRAKELLASPAQAPEVRP